MHFTVTVGIHSAVPFIVALIAFAVKNLIAKVIALYKFKWIRRELGSCNFSSF